MNSLDTYSVLVGVSIGVSLVILPAIALVEYFYWRRTLTAKETVEWLNKKPANFTHETKETVTELYEVPQMPDRDNPS